MNSKLTIYQNAKILNNNNFMVDNINDYLSTLNNMIFDNFQYVKNDLFVTIKLNMSQLDLERYFDFNYSKIEMLTSGTVYTTFYYFVINKKWLSQNTIQFELKLDTINTYQFNVDYVLTNKTKVIREHKDRFFNSFRTGQDLKTSRNIYYKTENILPKLYNYTPKYKIYYGDNAMLKNDDFYLIYKTRDLNENSIENPVDCLFCAGNQYKISDSNVYNFSVKDLEFNKVYYIVANDDLNPTLNIYDYTFTIGAPYPNHTNSFVSHIIIGKRILDNHERIVVEVYGKTMTSGGYYEVTAYNHIACTNEFTIENINYMRTSNPQQYLLYVDGFTKEEDVIESINSFPAYFINTINAQYLTKYRDIDLTDARIMKIFKLPYPPLNISIGANDILQYNTLEWEFYNGYLRLKDTTNTRLNCLFFDSNMNENHPFYEKDCVLKEGSRKVNYTDLKNINNESKLFHSDYFYSKFVYDSFSKIFKLEYLEDNLNTTTFTIDFIHTNTINSRFLFQFRDYVTKIRDEDYDNILLIDRNNETILLNNNYVNYIRTGYNYDVKNKNRENLVSWLQVGLSAGSSLASGSLNPFGAISQLAGTLSSSIARENAIQQKLSQLKMESTSVIGADDIDLLEFYCDNKAFLIKYELDDIMKNRLFALFYYTGYICEEFKIPLTNTRVWFNYLQCELDILKTNNLKESEIEDIKKRFENGITILHEVNYNDSNYWDFEQVHENYETFIPIE